MSENTVTGSFEIELTPAADLDGRVGRFDFTKVWTGGIAGTGRGAMFSAGDPGAGAAGYVAIEVVDGTIGGAAGSVTFLQQGRMADSDVELRYVVAPGSGTGALVGMAGELVLDGHDYTVTYTLPTS